MAINGRDLGKSKFVTIYIDGVGFADHTCVVALGITEDGQKRVLGLQEGATENSVVVNDLLADIVERGLVMPARVLFVIDGAKALRKAVTSTFGKRALVQRCTLHKQRNVLSYLPATWHREAHRRLRISWSMASYHDARAELKKVVRWLSKINESAAASLEEGFEETLTVHRLGIEGRLRRTLVTTNPIESAFDLVRTHARRVKRWRGSSMVMRWAGSGLVRAEQQFRRVKGFSAIPVLVAALENESLKESKVPA